jgi:hypothetical protein
MTLAGEPLNEVVELRVHGVHGTSPASMLGVPEDDVRQVAGDNLTGCYRSRSGALPYRDLSGHSVGVEAYSWGTLTSGLPRLLGWVQRALWLLLLPFALANLAYWARLRLDGTRASRWGVRYTRVGALLLTVLMVLIPTIIGTDLIAWQCYRGDSPGCTRLPGVLDFMADRTAGQRLALGSALPLLFLGILWLLSRQSLQRYEDVHLEHGPEGGGRGAVLRHPRLWSGKARTQQLQRVHLTVALATVVGFTGLHVAHDPRGDGAGRITVLVLAGVLAVAATLWACVIHPDDVEHDGARQSRFGVLARSPGYAKVHARIPDLLCGLMSLVTVLHLVALWRLSPALDQTKDFHGHNFWFIAVFVALTAVHLALFTGERTNVVVSLVAIALVLALAAGALVQHAQLNEQRSHALQVVLVVGAAAFFAVLALWQLLGWKSHRDEAWKGAGASVLLAAAAWVALLFTTGVVTATANYLNGSDHGVDDLVSRLADSETSSATDVVTQVDKGSTLGVSGDVVLRDAVITLDGPPAADGSGPVPVLRSGTVESERVFDVDQAAVHNLDGVALQKGRTRLRHGALVLDAERVRIRDSCVRKTDDSACSPESSRFLVGGMLQLPSSKGADGMTTIKVDSPHGVELSPSSPPEVPLVVPQVLIWAPLAQTLWLVGCVAWVLVALLLFRRARGGIDALAEQEIKKRDLLDCIKARRRAAFAHRAERLLDGVGVLTSVLAIALIGYSATGQAPWERYAVLRPFATMGMYVALGLGAGLVLLASRIRSSEGTRKAVGVLWDLTTFWPRAAHPLAPPCYAERVVPEVLTRVGWVLHTDGAGDEDDPRAGNRVILSGHSQGSVIVCAVLSRMSDDDLTRSDVITYGSQIRGLYGRVFPAVFGPEQIGYEPTPHVTRLTRAFPDAPDAPDGPDEGSGGGPGGGAPRPVATPKPHSLVGRLFAADGHWVNLFRRSDPLGFRVFSDRDVAPDVYVPEVPDVIVGDAGPQVNTHGGYQHTLAYRSAVADWTGEDVQVDPAGTVDIPALPV